MWRCFVCFVAGIVFMTWGIPSPSLGAFEIIAHSVDDVRYHRDERGRNCISMVKNRTMKRGDPDEADDGEDR